MIFMKLLSTYKSSTFQSKGDNIMIVVLTSNYNAGILQFACQMYNTISEVYRDEVVLFVPEQAQIPDDIKYKKYERKNIVGITTHYSNIANEIMKYSPNLIFVCDSNLITARIVNAIKKRTNILMCVHDVNDHPSYSGMLSSLKARIQIPFIRHAWNYCKGIILLSNNSLLLFKEKYASYAEKAHLLTLGAHIPKCVEVCPDELKKIDSNYILFFGRMDKYKGIETLLNAYVSSKLHLQGTKLVLAGNGALTEEENKIINNNTLSIILLKRYIKDEEMKWLFNHCTCVVLPYIEASQSGVLPIAYAYDKSVIVSNVKGLTDYVINGITGAVFNNQEELTGMLNDINSSVVKYEKNIKNYYLMHFSWNVNVKKCLDIWLKDGMES